MDLGAMNFQRPQQPSAAEENYWSNFYSHHNSIIRSSFCEYLLESDYAKSVIIDIGSGDGRDSFAFAQSNRRVFGFDFSVVGVRHCQKRASELGLVDRARFCLCDISDTAAFGPALQRALGSPHIKREPATFYCRFLLHAVAEETEDAMLDTLMRVARPDDVFAAEFRVEQDEPLPKVHAKHFRRYLDPQRFSHKLQRKHNFKVMLFQIGNGFSQYQGEDPILCRIVANC
jgi:Methyltransferase domain